MGRNRRVDVVCIVPESAAFLILGGPSEDMTSSSVKIRSKLWARNGGADESSVSKVKSREQSPVEPGDDRHAGRAECGKQSAEQAHHEREQQALADQARTELEVEHHLAEVSARC